MTLATNFLDVKYMLIDEVELLVQFLQCVDHLSDLVSNRPNSDKEHDDRDNCHCAHCQNGQFAHGQSLGLRLLVALSRLRSSSSRRRRSAAIRLANCSALLNGHRSLVPAEFASFPGLFALWSCRAR